MTTAAPAADVDDENELHLHQIATATATAAAASASGDGDGGTLQCDSLQQRTIDSARGDCRTRINCVSYSLSFRSKTLSCRWLLSLDEYVSWVEGSHHHCVTVTLIIEPVLDLLFSRSNSQ